MIVRHRVRRALGLALGVALALATLIAVQPAAASDPSGSVTVHVVDEQGDPVPFARVNLGQLNMGSWSGGIPLDADASGVAVYPMLYAGEYYVGARGGASSDWVETGSPADAFTLADGEAAVRTVAVQKGGRIAVDVRGPQGAPLRKVLLTLYEPAGDTWSQVPFARYLDAQTRTFDAGTAAFRNLPAGTYRVDALPLETNSIARGWALAGDVVVTPGETTSESIVLENGPTIVGGVTVSGVRAVGQTLTASATPSRPDATVTYSWWAWDAGEVATGPELRLTPGLSGANITLYAMPRLNGVGSSSAQVTVKLGKVAALSTLVVSGTPQVGRLLSAAPYFDSLATYQWLADGAVIPGATRAELTVSAAQLGKRISVRATARDAAQIPAAIESTATAMVVPGVLRTSAPVISGTPAVGSTVRANPGAWTPGVTLRYQWYSGSAAVRGATAPTLRLTTALKGKPLRVTVTATLAGYQTAARTSASTAGIAVAPKPKITGTSRVGHRLTASPGKWLAGTRLTYRWYSDGKAISGATHKTLLVKKSMRGHRLTVRVTGHRSGVATVAKLSGSRVIR